ncbi:cytochrome P450 [Pyxidicoccus fallax]|uniref:Cytochrome P450 n=1 Tax=Pyxidicoccus fallax TaxID=394095 RepID=A0A848LWZ8_9BACT|nr:cytochrome P450 [Pyxidicoccus fallax]NMO22668.1 cytochrome P450 [Pyxidicoccus fallax]NPC84777.1 cytochrome P450 [Pyxidicoccus fallax]
MSAVAGIDLTSESFFANPFPTFERLRNEAPVYFFEPYQGFILTRGAEIEALTKSPHFSSRRARELLGGMGLVGEDAASKDMLAAWSGMVFFQDPPRHTLLRQMVMKGFTPAALERFRPQVAALVERALEKGRREGEMDVLSDFAEPIAINAIAELFALPEADRPRFMRWAKDLLKPSGVAVNTDDIRASVRRTSNDMVGYLRNLVAERRAAPGDDFVSQFIAAEDGDPRLAGEAVIQSFQMIGAGFVTSTNQITNTVLALMKHPEQLSQLRADPGLIRGAIEESLRHEPAVLSINRLCVEDTELGGTRIPKGVFVHAMTASANRDPAVFPDPDRFDIARWPNRQVTFGVGAHYCPGASLVRIEVEEALRALLTLPRWELAGRPYNYQGSNFQDRGPTSLHLRFPKA